MANRRADGNFARWRPWKVGVHDTTRALVRVLVHEGEFRPSATPPPTHSQKAQDNVPNGGEDLHTVQLIPELVWCFQTLETAPTGACLNRDI